MEIETETNKKTKKKQKKGNKLAARVTLGFKDKSEGHRNRMIENVYGKIHQINMLNDTHVNMHKDKNKNLLNDDRGNISQAQVREFQDTVDSETMNFLQVDSNDMHDNGATKSTLRYAARSPDDKDTTGGTNVPRIAILERISTSQMGYSNQVMYNSMEEETIQENPELS